MAKKKWHNLVLPWNMFEMFSKSGKAVVFRFRDGDWKGYGFVRPIATVRKNRDGEGWSMGYTMEQTLDGNGDVVSEEPEQITVTKMEKQGEQWVTVDEQTFDIRYLENMI